MGKAWLYRGLPAVVVFLVFVWVGNGVYAVDGESAGRVVSDAVIAKVLLEIEDFPGEKAYWVELAKDLMDLHEGESFSDDKINAAIDALRQSGLFRHVHVDSEGAAKDIILRFRLNPFRLIKDVKIEGAFPLFEREVLKAMTIFVGDTYTEEKLARQESAVRDLFIQAGFPTPEIAVAAYEDNEDGHVVVQIRIDKGPYEQLRGLMIHGNRAFSTNRLRWKMKTYRVSFLPGYAGRFVEPDLKKDIETLIAFYRKSGFADAVVSYVIQEEPGTMGPLVTVNIEEGRLYHVVIIGNEEFWTRTLRKDLVLFQEGNKNDLGLKKSVKKIKERYRQAGYLETEVTMNETGLDEGKLEKRRILLSIHEGPRSTVRAIRITGNRALAEKEIRKQILTRPAGFMQKGAFVPETLSEDVYAVKTLYATHGYLEAGVEQHIDWNEGKNEALITLEIHEGLQTMVSFTRITGLAAISEEEALETIRLKHEEPFRTHMVQSDENALTALISERGYPHVQVTGDVEFSEDRSQAFVTYTIVEGPFVKAGQVYYRGNFRTKKKILNRAFTMKTGAPFSLVKMLEGQRNIRDLDLFDSVKIRAVGLKAKRQEVDFIVEVEEKKPYFFELGGGYESQSGLYAHAKVGDHNLFGTNKDGWLGVEVSEIGYRAESRIKEPRLFGSKISADAGAFSERREEFNKNFGTDIYGASLGLGRAWSEHLTTGLGFRFERRQQYKLEDVVLGQEPVDFDPRSLFVTTPSVRYDTRDSFIRPTQGSLVQLSVDISKGLTNDRDNFLKYRADFRQYVTPLSRLTFAWTARAGYLDPYGVSATIPEDQLFFLGGVSDVRGFDENLLCFDPMGDPLGGRSQLSGGVEARIDLGANFEFALFCDVGRIGNTFVDHETADTFRSSVGAGLRYITPIGPIGILYGRNIDPVDGEDSGRFHFAIGYTF